MIFASIKSRELSLLTFVFVVVLLVATFRANERHDSDLAHARQDLQANAKAIAEKQEDTISHTQNMLRFLINTVDLDSLSRDPACVETLHRLVSTEPAIANIFIVGVNGMDTCNAFPSPTPPNLSDRGYFQRAMASPEIVMGDPVFGRFTKKWVLPFAQRFNDKSGHTKGVIVVSLDLGWVHNEFKKRNFHPEMRIGLVSDKGTVLARYPEPEKWLGKDISQHTAFKTLVSIGGTGTTEEKSHDGQRRIYAFQTFAATEGGAIYLWLNQPLESVTAKADEQFYSAIMLVLILIVITFSIAWYGTNRLLIRPIEAIVRAARRLSEGDPHARTGIQHRQGEIGELAGAFDDMAYSLTRIDLVTSLPNQFSLEERLKLLIDEAQRHQKTFAVLQLDISNLQNLVNMYGFDVGDELLRRLAIKLQTMVGNECVVSRLGKSSFVIVCPDISIASNVSMLAVEQHAILTELIKVDDHEIHPEIVIGACFYPDDGQTPRELVQHAGAAVAQSMTEKKTYLGFFDRKMNAAQLSRVSLINDIHHAIERDEFELHYQPQVDLASGRFIGFEALVRWKHPAQGYLPPGQFISLAEESGLILPLGNWILKRAMSQMKEWQLSGIADPSMVIAVNVSAKQMNSGEFLDHLKSLLAEINLPAATIELELTESILISDLPQTQKLLRELKDMGIQLSIDDFGTGYSSLAYLKELAIDKLKIDKSFIDFVDTKPNDAAIVQAAIVMAHSLGLVAIAEGVENESQLTALRALKCDQIQGYYYSRPLPASDAARLLQVKRKDSLPEFSPVQEFKNPLRRLIDSAFSW